MKLRITIEVDRPNLPSPSTQDLVSLHESMADSPGPLLTLLEGPFNFSLENLETGDKHGDLK